MSKPLLQIIIASTRPGRIGAPVGAWFAAQARAHEGFDIEVIDLAEVNLPFMDEPKHPRFHDYQHDHTKRWSETITRGDAYVFVIPEYNHGFNAVVKNAVDFLHQEWLDKPFGFVSYGGVAAGTRAAQQLMQVLATLRMVPVVEAVNIPFVHQFLADGEIKPNDIMQAAAAAMLDELALVTPGLRSVRMARQGGPAI
jgi:NAD(P)H-dependent FMN reductase